jgi:hypothetical protein
MGRAVAAAERRVPREMTDVLDELRELSRDGVKGVVLTRALKELVRLTEAVSRTALLDAAASPSDYDVLISVLEDPAAVVLPRRDDPLTEARLRGIRAREEILEAGGGVLPAEEVARLLHLTRQGVDKRRRARRLIGLDVGRRGYAYPAWQFEGGAVLPGLEEALRAMRALDPWMQAAFMVTGNARLGGRTPLAELRRGRVEAVARAARAGGEHGAA